MKKIGIFLTITFVLTWGIAFILMANGGYSNPLATLIVMGCMFIPTIAAVITVFITKEGFKGIWIKPNFKGNIKYYLLAWFTPAILIILGQVLYFLIYPNQFDSNMTFMVNTVKEQLANSGQVLSDSQIRVTLISQLIIAILISPIVNFITCCGEELGWRGFLLPNLCKKYSGLIAVIISGVIWGLWHAPMIAMGHNYGLGYPTAPWGGILAMIVFCIFVGAFLSYITLKTKSALPAVISHGMINGFASSATLFLATASINPFIGPLPIGIIGGIGFIIVGIICLALIKKNELVVNNK